MATKERMDFCINCRKDTKYVLQKKTITKTIKDKEYSFDITVAICETCGEEMSIPGLLDYNVLEVDKQYRKEESLVSIEEIEKLMKIYKLGKAPMSLSLGFGEITIPRYLEGQIPSKEYSDIIKLTLSSPKEMKQRLKKNRNKLTDSAYNKALRAVEDIESLFSVSDNMLKVIAYLFSELNEVTPLMLQKLLYFIQGINLALYKRPMFSEDCQAWIHGPVFPKVYNLFKDFKYDPIDDARFAILDGKGDELEDSEKKVIDLVINTFGMYGGKTLEKITHFEEPWLDARKGYDWDIRSNEVLSKNTIKKYFISVDKEYGVSTEEGLNKYIKNKLKEAKNIRI